MPTEFEEKEYETLFNGELLGSGCLHYAPGQVKEKQLGFDAAFVQHSKAFWRAFPEYFSISHILLAPFQRTPSGIRLKPEYWLELDQVIEHFPPMKFNLFIQYKRPSLVRSKRSPEWHVWEREYFRYKLTAHQQLALENLARLAAHNALVTYASPAFSTCGELWRYADRRELTKNTNFAAAEALAGHTKYTYVVAGSHGMGHSDPERIEGQSFEARLAELESLDIWGDNRKFVNKLAELTDEAIQATPRAKTYSVAVKSFTELAENLRLPETALPMRKIAMFCESAKVSWFIGS